MAGLRDFLTLCNIGILFNVLDGRTYGEPGISYQDILLMDKFDYNLIPDEDRHKYVYARGISLELVSWLNSWLIVTDIEGNANPLEILEIEDLQVQYITRQGLTMSQYLETWVAEEQKKDDPRNPTVDMDSLEKQLEWAMDTIPWIESSWSDTLKENDESFYLDSLYPASGQPLPRDEKLPFAPWSET
jgi:hypothetical protein